MKTLALIPARGGSKGVPNKNSKLLSGKPLIQYTIDAAIACEKFDKIVVSTDSQEILNIAEKLGVEVPGLRPAHLASDTSPTIDTVIYTLNYYLERGESFDSVCLLQPTTPMRTNEDIIESINRFKELGTDSLVTVNKVPHEFNPHWVFEADPETNELFISTGENEIIKRRQDLPDAYYRNGAIYITKTEVLLNQKSLYGNKIGFHVMDDTKHVNIDTLKDWQLAEELLNRA